MSDLISRQAAIDAFDLPIFNIKGKENAERFVEYIKAVLQRIKELPSAEPDFSCDGCMTPKHICGICMRNYPNITDHYCTGEAWEEAEEDALN